MYKMSNLLTENVIFVKFNATVMHFLLTPLSFLFAFMDGVRKCLKWDFFYAFMITAQSNSAMITMVFMYCGNRLYFCNFIYL